MPLLLIIGYVWPEPNSSAAGSRMMQLISSFLARGYRINFASPADFSDHAVDLQALGVDVTAIELNNTSFDEFVAELQPQVVLFDRFMMEEQFAWRVSNNCPQAIRILNMEDLHSLRHARQQAIKAGGNSDDAELNTEMAHRELAAIFRSDLTLVISPFEYQLIHQHYQVPESQLLLLPFMLAEPTQPSSLPFEQRHHFVSIGNFRHAPNWDAVLQLRQLWPAIRRQCGDAELHIYGAYPPKKATQLHNSAIGFHIKGWAQDVTELMSNARVLLAPLRFGAGLKGKLLDAMCHGLPSVTTPIGAEGMTVAADWPGAVRSEDQAFIDEAVRLYQDRQAWQQAVAQIPAHLVPYQRSTLEQALFERIYGIDQDINGHRQQHFIGAMLQHHSLKSTQYMSQWIEAKNKLKSQP
ncbi:glycosyltransferase [Neiella litorisoli]|uniref:glycosyltransferase n=1 Tax=Neiella litorisoli TaxID=2771431 RepID=UPI001CD0889C|nr:glycosyltransferase family 4 protein [Neiella litorisoli]